MNVFKKLRRNALPAGGGLGRQRAAKLLFCSAFISGQKLQRSLCGGGGVRRVAVRADGVAEALG